MLCPCLMESLFFFQELFHFRKISVPFFARKLLEMEVGREIFPMIYFQSLSPWETDSGRLKQGIEIKRKYENYKNRWLLCQLLMYFKMEEIDASLSEKWFKSLCEGSSLVLSKRFSNQYNWRACSFWHTCPLWTGCATNILSMYCQKHRKNCECCPGHYLSTSVY